MPRSSISTTRFSPATLNRRLSFLRRYASFAAAREPALRETAAGFAALPFQAVARRTTRALAHADEQRLRAAARDLGPQCGAAIAVLLGTGLRAADIAGLSRGDVVGPHATPSALRVRGPRAKTVILGPLAQRGVADLLAAERGGSGDPLFRGSRGAPLGEEGIAALVERAARGAGVGATPRTLRHTFAVRYLSEHRDDLDGLAQALGHVGLAAVRAYRAEAESGGPVVDVRRWADVPEAAPAPGVRRRSFPGSRFVVERDLVAPGTELVFGANGAERMSIVLAGRVQVRCGPARFEAGAGDFVPAPAGAAYRISIVGDRPALLLHVVAAPRRASAPR